MISVENLCKSFGELEILKGITENIEKGEKVVIIGPSGSGKSTFLRCLNLLEKPTSGSIIFEGTDITNSSEKELNLMRQKMGMVFQQFNLFPNLSIINNITLAPVKLKLMTKEEAEAKDNPVWKCMLLMVIGGILVVKGSDFAVSGATEIARYFGMSERFIGLTIVALGTSLPELVTSVTAARRGNTGIAIGNIVGSNIFNILFVIGTTALICTVPFESKFIIDTVVAVLCGAILWIGTFRHKELRKPCGVVMLLCYVAYFLYLCLV